MNCTCLCHSKFFKSCNICKDDHKELEIQDADFESRNKEMIQSMSADKHLADLSKKWYLEATGYQYSYHFKWLGLPIIQFPQDIMAVQELIWKVKPDLIIETGIARGGSLVFYASLLELIGEDGIVLGIDIDIRKHNRTAIENHPMYKRIKMIEGSSIDQFIVKKVGEQAIGRKNIMVLLDSYHTYEHVMKEIKFYSKLVSKGSYLIVFDTMIEQTPKEFLGEREWCKGNSPMDAVREFLKNNDNFEIDHTIEAKLLVTECPSGYLRRIKN